MSDEALGVICALTFILGYIMSHCGMIVVH